ncbi:MAG: hypothetical protein ACPL5I_03160 [Thermodesulfobacteriota bacterium]
MYFIAKQKPAGNCFSVGSRSLVTNLENYLGRNPSSHVAITGDGLPLFTMAHDGW